MERCFNRIEIQTVFESSIDTKNGLLCEAFNPDNNSYCKKYVHCLNWRKLINFLIIFSSPGF